MSGPALGRLCALEQLEVHRQYPRLLPLLLGRGLGPEDAVAVAFNATLLSRALERKPTPRQVLEQYDLGKIAALCGEYLRVKAGEVEYGTNGSFEEEAGG